MRLRKRCPDFVEAFHDMTVKPSPRLAKSVCDIVPVALCPSYILEQVFLNHHLESHLFKNRFLYPLTLQQLF
jgi:hypothetical protein